MNFSRFLKKGALVASITLFGGLMFSAGTLAAAQLMFPDVPEGLWFSGSVEQLAKMEVVKGYPDGSFRPDQAVQRAEMATMLARYHRYLLEEYFPQRSELDQLFLESLEDTSAANTLVVSNANGESGTKDGAGTTAATGNTAKEASLATAPPANSGGASAGADSDASAPPSPAPAVNPTGNAAAASIIQAPSDLNEQPLSPSPTVFPVTQGSLEVLDVYEDPIVLYQERCSSQASCQQVQASYDCDIVSPVKGFLPKIPMMNCDRRIRQSDLDGAVFTDSTLDVYQRNFVSQQNGQTVYINTLSAFSKTFAPIVNPFDALNFLQAVTRERAAASLGDLIKYEGQGSYEWYLSGDDMPFTNIVKSGDSYTMTLFTSPKLPCGSWNIEAKQYRVLNDAEFELINSGEVGKYQGTLLCE
ncbi:MAG: S-layer homology domain-containing protein [bacterium]|nr:S-layer homology domain-containing protein [bacterium]